MTMGQLVGRLVKEGLDRHDPSRPPRRARSGSRSAPPTPRRTGAAGEAPRDPADTAAASKTDPDGPPSFDAGSQPAVQRRAASTTKDAAIPAGAAPTPARAVRPIPTKSTAPPLRRRSHALRAARLRRVSEVRQRDGGGCSYVDPQTGKHLIEIEIPGNLDCVARHRHAHGRSPLHGALPPSVGLRMSSDDEIIAEIRRSRFLVADFTHGEDREGVVYFEAGFALGLAIPRDLYLRVRTQVGEILLRYTAISPYDGLRDKLEKRSWHSSRGTWSPGSQAR